MTDRKGRGFYDSFTVTEEPRSAQPRPGTVADEEANDSSASFSANENSGEDMQTGGVDSAGEDDDQELEGEAMEWL